MPNSDELTQHAAFFVAPNFSMMSLLSMTEPLRAANEIAGREVYRLSFMGEASTISAINGMSISTDDSLPRSTGYDFVAVCASYEPEKAASAHVHGWLRWLDVHGVTLGAIDTGAYILAEAGLLTYSEVAMHWVNLKAFRELYPRVRTTTRMNTFSQRRFFCAGATAGIDTSLKIIETQHGSTFAAQVANHFIHTSNTVRAELDQSAIHDLLSPVRNKAVRETLKTMEGTEGQKLSIAALATMVNLSAKQLANAFRKEMGERPAQVYQKIRLNKARSLLMHTDMTIENIALTCGFASRSQFSRVYKALFGASPKLTRVQAHVRAS